MLFVPCVLNPHKNSDTFKITKKGGITYEENDK